MSFFKQKVSFSSKFGSFFSVMRDTPSVIFKLKLYMLFRNVAHQRVTFRLATGHIKIHQIPHAIFGTKSQFLLKLWTLFSVVKQNSFVFYHLNLYMLWAKRSNQSANFQTFVCSHKINQMSYVIFQTTSRLFFKFCITLQCLDTDNPSEVFLLKHNPLDKKNPLMYNFSDF